MRSLALALAVALPLTAAAQTPAPSQEWSPPRAEDPSSSEAESGLDLIERGAGIIFDNLLREMQPQMEGMARGLEDTVNRFGPALDDLAVLIDDIKNYQAPERLPNGDILLRRRPDAPPAPPVGDALRDLTRPAPESRPETLPSPAPTPAPEGEPVAPHGPITL